MDKDNFNADAMAKGLIADSPDVTATPDMAQDDETAPVSGSSSFLPVPDETDERYGKMLHSVIAENLKEKELSSAKKEVLAEIGSFAFSLCRSIPNVVVSKISYLGLMLLTALAAFWPEIKSAHEKFKGLEDADSA